MAASVYVMYGIATLSIVLGFVALLKQKTYIDSATNQPIEIELPFLGKLKTNVPAIVLVVLGISVAFLVFEKSYSGLERAAGEGLKEAWLITGSLRAEGPRLNWPDGTLTPFPRDYDVDISSSGTFEIRAQIPVGKTFEDMVEAVDYSHPRGSVGFVPSEEYARFERGDSSTLIAAASERMRRLKPLAVQRY